MKATDKVTEYMLVRAFYEILDGIRDTEWTFIELDERELESLVAPESLLDCHMFVLHSSGMANYKAYGKHTNDHYWTAGFPLVKLTGWK